ncbi:Uncharacterised protein [Campylobacter insulaenigrae]|uniref:hypothetical protein n=1 Tax=Campylobacter insulaenigrae TaxID=260714 RepID=UPI000F6EA894|nr:hypothetical protein [Campylobacter insulaenigrae]MCR6574305.1 hypothetical protein [Campylobacter insulaenigrae]MCR6590499.1 hypothetical protein [Campylobacter insulaenigrae]MCR6592036.1 hypothetical protein [Campylobacter insulaenigrae]VEJ53305.1 Uncharacterised protein [Campylobacter insulaenigrae]
MNYKKLTIKTSAFKHIYGLGLIITLFVICNFWQFAGEYMINILPSFLSPFYGLASFFAFCIIMISCNFIVFAFSKNKRNKLKPIQDTLLFLIFISLAGVMTQIGLDYFLNYHYQTISISELYNNNNAISVALFSLGNYFFEKNYFFYLLGISLITFIFFILYLEKNKITLKTEFKTSKNKFSEKEKFYLSLFGCVLLIFIFVCIYFTFSWLMTLIIV